MTRYLPGFAFAVLLAFGSADPAVAQSNCTASYPASCSPGSNALRLNITVGRAIYMSLSPGSTTLTPPTVADYNLGYAPTTGPTATVKANTAWTLSISSSSATWSAVDTQTEPARVGKPASDLGWSTTVGGTFVGLTTTPVMVTTGTRSAGTVVTLFYRTSYSWTLDTPGNYTLPVVFTLTSP